MHVIKIGFESGYYKLNNSLLQRNAFNQDAFKSGYYKLSNSLKKEMHVIRMPLNQVITNIAISY